MNCLVCNYRLFGSGTDKEVSFATRNDILNKFSDNFNFFEITVDSKADYMKIYKAHEAPSRSPDSKKYLVLRCNNCQFVMFKNRYEISNQLKREILSGTFFDEFQDYGLQNIHNFELMAKNLLIEEFPHEMIAILYLWTLKFSKYTNERRKYITMKLEYILNEMITNKENFIHLDNNVIFSILGESFRRINMFDRSLKYFSNINKDFVSKPLIKNLIKLSTARNPMIMKKINPIDAYSSIELDTLNPLDYFENNLDYLRFTMIVRL